MGYQSRLTGALAILPPLKWSEYRESEFFNETDDSLLKLVELQDTQDSDGASVVVRTALWVAPRREDAVKAYSLEQELARLAEVFGPAHTFLGYLIRKGEETGDVERYWIEGTTAKSESARLSWPDGTEVQL